MLRGFSVVVFLNVAWTLAHLQARPAGHGRIALRRILRPTILRRSCAARLWGWSADRTRRRAHQSILPVVGPASRGACRYSAAGAETTTGRGSSGGSTSSATGSADSDSSKEGSVRAPPAAPARGLVLVAICGPAWPRDLLDVALRVGIVRQLPHLGLDLLEELGDVLMARKHQDLMTVPSEIAQQNGRRLGPSDVEINQHIVEHQRHMHAPASISAEQRQSQRQKKLLAGPAA